MEATTQDTWKEVEAWPQINVPKAKLLTKQNQENKVNVLNCRLANCDFSLTQNLWAEEKSGQYEYCLHSLCYYRHCLFQNKMSNFHRFL